jgi:tetratricopeptide (TPR) repeat protein
VRWATLIALLLAAARADARPVPAAARDDGASALWREVIEPHGVEVAALLARARAAMERRDESATTTTERRTRLAAEAFGMMRHAHRLSPENTEVLTLLGQTADELGKTQQAIDALESCIRLQGPERAGPEVTGRLGAIYLRLGKLDDAVRWLRFAQGPISVPGQASLAVQLATALAARGQMPDAIDALANALPSRAPSYFNDPMTLVSFALAVHYDRDEQRGAAFEILDRMQATLQPEFGAFIQRALGELRFAPAEDEYYYQALLYEAIGAYTEARAEWALYAAVPDATWRHRALEHLDALDALRAAAPPHLPAKLSVP